MTGPVETEHNILIVDDVAKNIQVAAGILKDEGYNIAFAQSGGSALEQIAAAPFDLILLDIMMPEMDGFAVCEQIRRNPATEDVPVIFLTAKNETESIVRGFETGAADYVTKPFNGAELLARVRTHLALHRNRRALKAMNAQLRGEIASRKAAEEKLRENAEKFREMAIHDNLTGLYNTRHLYQALPELIQQAGADRRPFSLIFLDIDNFKKVVDAHGHLNGSQTLCEVAETLRQALTPPAYGVAYGGDEFVAVLPGFDKTRALEKAEEVRARMGGASYLRDKGFDIRLTASFGIAAYPDDAADMTGLLALADRAMFDIKEKGKNAVGALPPPA